VRQQRKETGFRRSLVENATAGRDGEVCIAQEIEETVQMLVSAKREVRRIAASEKNPLKAEKRSNLVGLAGVDVVHMPQRRWGTSSEVQGRPSCCHEACRSERKVSKTVSSSSFVC
jgi:hypothetical protein